MKSTDARQLAWIAAPLLVYLAVLQHLWFNAPVWDDYDTILGLLIRADELHSAPEWLAMIWSQHNEHRIAVTRLIALGLARTFGSIDFRMLMLLGNLSLLGTFLFIWREFRAVVPAAAIGAAAILMFQWSYFEASLMGSAALPHLGVVFFSFGCLYLAVRGGPVGVGIAAVMGLLAAASQANGLFALPIAAAGCAFLRMRGRAALFAVLAALAWILYFHGYVRPPHHPSPFLALSSPLATIELFLVVVGGVVPGSDVPMAFGGVVVAGLAWLTYKGFWRAHPVAAMWTLFLLATAGAAAVGRVGFGVAQASRYAIGSTCLAIIVCLGVCTVTRWHSRIWMAVALAGAVTFSIIVSWKAWPQVQESSLRGHLLKEAVPMDGAVITERFGGAFYPNADRAKDVLTVSAQRGYYFPPKQPVYGARMFPARSELQGARPAGHVDGVGVTGQRVIVTGWSDITALLPSRMMQVISSPAFTAAEPVEVVARPDVVWALRDPDLLFSGFRLQLDYASEEDAKAAAQSLCMVMEAPGRPRTRLAALQSSCGIP